MKIYLIAALFLGALVVAHSFEEDEKVELPEVPEQEEQSDEEINDAPGTEDAPESEDEVAEKRALKNVLSRYSCLQLKKRRYCRHAIIRNLCAATCKVKPPVCRDNLSRVSCLRIKSLKKCNYAIARLYCRRTCGHCPNDPCRKYAVLNQLNRRQSKPRGNARPICDQKGFATRWYRFTGLAGNRMPNRAPPVNRCGTHASGWMVGSYPAVGQTVARKVCYHWSKNKCKWNNPIKVKNCGRYYVFYLRPTPVCHLRYCGNA